MHLQWLDAALASAAMLKLNAHALCCMFLNLGTAHMFNPTRLARARTLHLFSFLISRCRALHARRHFLCDVWYGRVFTPSRPCFLSKASHCV